MSDDLISRKAVYKAFSDYLNRNFLGEISPQTELRVGEIASIISSIPTAFDKEKVIEELKLREDNALQDLYDKQDEKYRGMVEAYSIAAKIVEKGGIG